MNEKSQNLRRLQAQRNELNAKGMVLHLPATLLGIVSQSDISFVTLVSVRLLREELQLLQEQGSYVGEVVRVMDKKKVLVKVCCVHSPCSILLFESVVDSLNLCLFIISRCIQRESLWWMWTKTLTSMM